MLPHASISRMPWKSAYIKSAKAYSIQEEFLFSCVVFINIRCGLTAPLSLGDKQASKTSIYICWKSPKVSLMRAIVQHVIRFNAKSTEGPSTSNYYISSTLNQVDENISFRPFSPVYLLIVMDMFKRPWLLCRQKMRIDNEPDLLLFPPPLSPIFT